MPNGKFHTRTSLVLAGGFIVGTLVSGDISNLQYAAGALAGVFLTPDLDVDHGRIDGNNIIRRRGGVVVDFGWRSVWYMYRRSLRHGGELSHFPVISTLGRLIYLFLFVIVIPYLFVAPAFHLNIWSELTWWAWKFIVHYKVILGLMSSDFLHWLFDITTKEHKRRQYATRQEISNERW